MRLNRSEGTKGIKGIFIKFFDFFGAFDSLAIKSLRHQMGVLYRGEAKPPAGSEPAGGLVFSTEV